MKHTMSPTTTTADTTKARTTITIAATIPLWSQPVYMSCWGSSVPDERVADDTDEDLGLTGTFLVVAAATNVCGELDTLRKG